MFGRNILVRDVDGDGGDDIIISAPSAGYPDYLLSTAHLSDL